MTDSVDDLPPTFFQRYTRSAFGLDNRSLAVFRILLGLLILIDLYDRSQYFVDFYTDSGFLTRQLDVEFLSQGSPEDYETTHGMPLPYWSIHLANGEVWFGQLLFGLQAVCAVVLILGWQTRIFVIASWLILISLHVRNPLILNSGDTLLRMMLFWSIFLPLGARWSLDRVREKTPREFPPVHVSMASVALIIQLCIIYWFSGYAKYNDIWLQGDAIRNVLNQNIMCRPLGKQLLEFPVLIEWICYGTLVLELVVPFALFIPFKTHWFRLLVIGLFCSFHIGIFVVMPVGLFSAVSITCWLALLPREFWNSTLVSKLSAGILGTESLLDADNDDAFDVDRSSFGTWLHRATQVALAVVLVYVLMWNVWRIRPNDENYTRFMPASIRGPGLALMINQEFHMFDYPPPVDYWLVYEARLKNGQLVDLFSGKQIESGVKPNDIYSRYRDHRWRRFHANLFNEEYVMLREPVTQYFIDQWNESHTEEYQVVRAQFRSYQEDTRPEATPGNLTFEIWSDIELESDPLRDMLRQLESGGGFLP